MGLLAGYQRLCKAPSVWNTEAEVSRNPRVRGSPDDTPPPPIYN